MKIEMTEGKGLSRSLKVTIPADAVSERLSKHFTTLAGKVKLDGFRPGQAPLKVVRERFGDEARGEVARQLVQEYLPQALEKQKLRIAGQPRVSTPGKDASNFTVADDAAFTFNADVELMPEISAKNYTGLKLTKHVAEVNDDVVKDALDRLKNQMKQFKDTAKAAKMGDRVTITGDGYTKAGKKEEKFDGGNLKDFKVVLGSGSLIPGFEDGLVGAKKGDSVDVDVTFPKDYHASQLAGKPAVFKLKVNAVEEGVAEDLTDASVKVLGMDSLEQLKTVIKSGAERDLALASTQRLKRELLDSLDESNTFEVPGVMVDNEMHALLNAQMQELQRRGLPPEAMGDPQEVIKQIKPLAERRVRLGLLMAEIARSEKIEVTNADIDQAVQNQIAMAGPQGEQVRQYFANPQNRNMLAGPVMEDKVSAWLLEKATITEKKAKAAELLTELQG
ncbi:MAG TPA: trigger factor [Alphaproteobacteria bacterium]|nr:trigger factor [Alphaproteobacteria bacterium]